MNAPAEVLGAVDDGLSVIPVGINKRAVGPWKRWQWERADRAQLEKWARSMSSTCWAVVTGAVSARVVLDFDGEEGGRLRRELGLEPHVRTGSGGHHVYFPHPGFYVPTLNGKAKRKLGERWPGLDLKGDGGYAIFAGSNGAGAYRMLRPLADPEPLDRLPEELRRDLGLVAPEPPTAELLLERYLARTKPGARNVVGFELACQLRDNGHDEATARAALREYVRRCPEGEEPYAEPEALASVEQAYRRAAREPWAARPIGSPLHLPAGEPLRLVSLEQFAAADEPSAEPLLGGEDDAAFTVGGTIITYGDGGVGKTTLALDGIAHLAAGLDWLGLKVPRAARVVVIENEGPRGNFRRKLRRKIASWQGASFMPFAPNVRVLEEPWCAFSFADEQHRAALARGCDDFGADLLLVGPLVNVGVEGGGTPDEVKAFELLLADFRARLERPVAVWLAHHENKSGDVSGAWERMPDALMHVSLEGQERTKLHWRKTRWSSSLHGDTWTLRWAPEREGFNVEPKGEEVDLRAEIRALFDRDAEPAWRTSREVAKPQRKGGIGRNREDVENELAALVAEDEFEFAEGPVGKAPTAKCYRPSCWLEAAKPAEPAVDSQGPEGRVGAGSPDRPPEGGRGRSQQATTDPRGGSAPEQASECRVCGGELVKGIRGLWCVRCSAPAA